MKSCTKCKQSKSECEFSKNKRCSDGLQPRCKSCFKEYYQNNKEKMLEYGAEYRNNNKDKVTEWWSEYYEKNKEHLLNETAKYREENREQIAKQTAAWKRANPEKVARYRRERRARELGAEKGIPYTSSEIFERDNWICQLCEEPVIEKDATQKLGPTIDHIIPLSKGGTECKTNVQLAHMACNSSKGNRVQI